MSWRAILRTLHFDGSWTDCDRMRVRKRGLGPVADLLPREDAHNISRPGRALPVTPQVLSENDNCRIPTISPSKKRTTK